MALKGVAAILFAFSGALCAQADDMPVAPSSSSAPEDAPPPPVAPSVSAESAARASDRRASPQPPIGASGAEAGVMSGRVQVVPNECLGLEGAPRDRCMQRYSPTGSGGRASRE